MKNRSAAKIKNTAYVVLGAIALVAGGIWLVNRTGPAAQTPVAPALAEDSHAEMHKKGEATNIQDFVGKPAPAFTLQDKNGTTYSMENLKGKKVVLFFNEGLMCYPSCWNQMVSLADDKRFANDDVVTLAVVTDQSSEWDQALQKMPSLARATVVFDAAKDASMAYGMLTVPSSMHYGTYPGHSYVVMDREGIIRFAMDDSRMGINNDILASKLSELP